MAVRGVGRPTKYSPEVADRIAEAINAGATKRLAAMYGGVSYDALNEWEKGEGGITKGEYRQFRQKLESAEAKAAMRKLARIEKAGHEGDWRADAWWLERRLPDEYGKTAADINVSGSLKREYVIITAADAAGGE